jgi:hypothetical protein
VSSFFQILFGLELRKSQCKNNCSIPITRTTAQTSVQEQSLKPHYKKNCSNPSKKTTARTLRPTFPIHSRYSLEIFTQIKNQKRIKKPKKNSINRHYGLCLPFTHVCILSSSESGTRSGSGVATNVSSRPPYQPDMNRLHVIDGLGVASHASSKPRCQPDTDRCYVTGAHRECCIIFWLPLNQVRGQHFCDRSTHKYAASTPKKPPITETNRKYWSLLACITEHPDIIWRACKGKSYLRSVDRGYDSNIQLGSSRFLSEPWLQGICEAAHPYLGISKV